MDAAFPKQVRLTDAKDFKQVFADAKRISNSLLVLLYRRNGLQYSRLGLAISKKHVAKAVKRNKAKRLIREHFRADQSKYTGLDIVVLSRAGLGNASNRDIVNTLQTLWSELNRRCAA